MHSRDLEQNMVAAALIDELERQGYDCFINESLLRNPNLELKALVKMLRTSRLKTDSLTSVRCREVL